MKNFFLFLAAFVFLSCNKGASEKLAAGEALGTTYRIVYFSEEEVPLEKGLDSIFEAINQSMSTYRENSDISRINNGESGIVVDSNFREVFRLSQQVYEESGGYFDPTVGDLVNLYGFGPEKGLISIDSADIDSIMAFVGLNKIKISADGNVVKELPQVYLDFNAIAKGYAVDVIGEYLKEQGVRNFLVELGGELLAKGENLAKGAPWTVGIDDPRQEGGERVLKAAIALKDRAMATSGNYRKFRTDSLTGRRYVHTINPLTGYPEENDLLSVTVLANTCALADAYATAFMAMGLEKSQALAQQLKGVEVYLLYSEADGTLSDYFTDGFEAAILEEY